MAYRVVATGLPDDADGAGDLRRAGRASSRARRTKAIAALPPRAAEHRATRGKVVSALAAPAARAQGLRRRRGWPRRWWRACIGEAGDEREGDPHQAGALREAARRSRSAPLTDRLWQTHLFHPKVRGPICELMAHPVRAGRATSTRCPSRSTRSIPKKHRIDVASAQEYQSTTTATWRGCSGMEAVELYSPFLVATRERHGQALQRAGARADGRRGDAARPTRSALRVGGKFFAEQGQKEVYYLLGRTLALVRPELALQPAAGAGAAGGGVPGGASACRSQRSASRADPRRWTPSGRLLEKACSEPARAALAKVARVYLPTATPTTCATTWRARSSRRCAPGSSPRARWSRSRGW